jgi:hypothetical protein
MLFLMFDFLFFFLLLLLLVECMVFYRSFLGVFWKAARIGERLSPYVSICCIMMAMGILFF